MDLNLPDLVPYSEYPHADPALVYARMSQVGLDARVEDQISRALKDAESSRGEYYVAQVFSDSGITAWREDVLRPEFELFMDALRSGRYRVVVVWEESRITRDPVVGAQVGRVMQKICARLVVTNGESRTVYDFTRQRDRDSWHNAVGKSVSDSGLKSELVREAKTRKSERNEYRGAPVGFGWAVSYKREGKKFRSVWTVNEDEAEWLRRASQLVRAGKAVHEVAELFYQEGLRIRHRPSSRKDYKGETGALTRQTLAGYLRNPRIAGLHAAGNTKTGYTVIGTLVNFPAILTEAEWRETVAVMAGATEVVADATGAEASKKSKRVTRRSTGTRVRHTYAGYYVCFECKRSLVRTNASYTSLWRHRLGGAIHHVECPHSFSIPAGRADDLMDDLVAEYVRSHDWVTPVGPDAATLGTERAAILAKIADLPKSVVAGTVSVELAGATEREYKVKLRTIENDLRRIAARTPVIDGETVLADLRSGDLAKRRRALAAVLDRVIVIPGADLPLRDRMRVEWKAQNI